MARRVCHRRGLRRAADDPVRQQWNELERARGELGRAMTAELHRYAGVMSRAFSRLTTAHATIRRERSVGGNSPAPLTRDPAAGQGSGAATPDANRSRDAS